MKTKDTVALVLGFLMSSATLGAVAQLPVAHPGDRICWDQPAASLADAQALTFTTQYDNAAANVVAVVCEGLTSPFACATAIPLLTNGTHRAIVTARNSAGLVFVSDPFDFAFDAPIDYRPLRLRIVGATVAGTIKK